jgi:hypothetical protein
MIADYFTKPLQGALFYKFRDKILGLALMEAIHGDQRSVLESNPSSASNQQSPMKGVGRQTTLTFKGPDHDVHKRLKVAHGHQTWAQVARSCIATPRSPRPQSNKLQNCP